jgi:superkiller protein 3
MVVLAVLITCARTQTTYWRNSETLWNHTLACTPDNNVAHNNLGDAFYQQGRMDEAIAQYQRALEIKPDNEKAHYNLGNVSRDLGRMNEAISRYQKALAINPNYVEAINNLGVVFARQGRMEEAIAHFQKALIIKPDDANIHYNLGNAFRDQGRMEEAIAQFQKALAIKPNYVEAQDTMARVLATCPQSSLRNGIKAVGLAERANQLAGGKNPMILATLAAAYAEAGRFPEAVETAQRALRLTETPSNTALAGALQSQLKLYQAGTPFHGTEQVP